jgi:hypothetical protein
VCFLLYKWKKNKQEQKNAIPKPGREEGVTPAERSNHEPIKNSVNNNHGQEILPVPAENENRSNNEPIDNNVYNHGQEAIPNVNENLSLQNIDDVVLQHLVQTLSQEIMTRKEKLQNTGQAPTTKDNDK